MHAAMHIAMQNSACRFRRLFFIVNHFIQCVFVMLCAHACQGTPIFGRMTRALGDFVLFEEGVTEFRVAIGLCASWPQRGECSCYVAHGGRAQRVFTVQIEA